MREPSRDSERRFHRAQLELADRPSVAATMAVFRDSAAYYAREADKALSGLCLNLGWNMRQTAESLDRCAKTLESLAASRVPPSTNDCEQLRAAEEAVERLASWLKGHKHLDAYRRELARIREEGLERADEARQKEAGESLQPTQLHVVHDDGDRSAVRVRAPRYLVAELEPTFWRVPFELPCEELEQAFEIFTQRAGLHVAVYGEPRPLIVLDRETGRVVASTGR